MARASIAARLAALRGGILNTIDLFMTRSLRPLAPVILGAIVIAVSVLLMRMGEVALIQFHRMAGSAFNLGQPGGQASVSGSLVGRGISDADLTWIEVPVPVRQLT